MSCTKCQNTIPHTHTGKYVEDETAKVELMKIVQEIKNNAEVYALALVHNAMCTKEVDALCNLVFQYEKQIMDLRRHVLVAILNSCLGTKDLMLVSLYDPRTNTLEIIKLDEYSSSDTSHNQFDTIH